MLNTHCQTWHPIHIWLNLPEQASTHRQALFHRCVLVFLPQRPRWLYKLCPLGIPSLSDAPLLLLAMWPAPSRANSHHTSSHTTMLSVCPTAARILISKQCNYPSNAYQPPTTFPQIIHTRHHPLWFIQFNSFSHEDFFYRKLTKCGHLEDKTLAVVSLILSLL
jgi:hypothetical protein